MKHPLIISPSKWARLSKTAKATAIATDALYRVKAKLLTPKRGTWTDFNADREFFEDGYVSGEADLQTALKAGASCQACALGGAVCGVAFYEDRMTRNAAHFHNSETRARLIAIFGRDNLAYIESAFERGRGAFQSSAHYTRQGDFAAQSDFLTDDLDQPTLKRAIAFGRRYRTDAKRFVAIWRNVERNKGVFKP